MDVHREQSLVEWAHEYNGYERLARDPSLLGDLMRTLQDEYRRTSEIPEWAGVDLLRGWAFFCVREHRFSGYGPLSEEYPEFYAIVDALHRHPAATEAERPPV